MTADIDHSLDERRDIRFLMEWAMRNGVPAAELRDAIAHAEAAGDTLHDRYPVYDDDIYQRESERLIALGLCDRADFGL
jgi:hypothetical protein